MAVSKIIFEIFEDEVRKISVFPKNHPDEIYSLEKIAAETDWFARPDEREPSVGGEAIDADKFLREQRIERNRD